jgi:hypothetical protein
VCKFVWSVALAFSNVELGALRWKNGLRCRVTQNLSKFSSMRRQNNSLLVSAAAGQTNATTPCTYNVMARLHDYQHPDRVYRRVPPTWSFPALNLRPMYVYWHCGDEHNNILPMKYLDKNDVKFIGKRANVSLSELRKVIGCIDEGS